MKGGRQPSNPTLVVPDSWPEEGSEGEERWREGRRGKYVFVV